MMPNFISVGAAKAGTTTLYRVLSDHPDVFMSPMKEPHYFSFPDKPPHYTGPHDKPINTTEVVSSRAKYESLFEGSESFTAVGEASNSYLYFPEAAQRIKDAIPHCKIIIMLRNPIERAFSHYRQAYALGHESLSFEDALRMETERRDMGWRWHYQYTAQSLYAEAVERYYHLFGRKNVCILRFEELSDIESMINKVYSFIGVDSSFCDFEKAPQNITELPRSRWLHSALAEGSVWRKGAHRLLPPALRAHLFNVIAEANRGNRFNPKLRENTRRELINFFTKDIRKLSQITNIDFSEWREGYEE